MRHLILGMGEIGSALSKVLPGHIQTHDRNLEPITLPIDFMHVAIPYSKQFVKIVKDYKKKFSPRYTIIYSTVAVGTTRMLGENVAHSPVEGIHPKLASSLKIFPRWISSTSDETAKAVEALWKPITECRVIDNPDFTEFVKMYSTSKYGINIVFADYAKKWTDKLGADYELVKQFDRDYNKLYYRLERPQFRRYILDPPNGKIGGHCLIPNAKVLDDQMPHPMLKMIKEYE